MHLYTLQSPSHIRVVSDFTKLPASAQYGDHVAVMMSITVQWISSLQTYLCLPITDYVTLSASVYRLWRIISVKAVNCPVSRLSGIGYTLTGTVVHGGCWRSCIEKGLCICWCSAHLSGVAVRCPHVHWNKYSFILSVCPIRDKYQRVLDCGKLH